MDSIQTQIDSLKNSNAATGPFTQLLQQAKDLFIVNLPADLHWPIILLILIIATAIWFIRQGHGAKGADVRARKARLLTFLLPRDIYTHQSARVDV